MWLRASHALERMQCEYFYSIHDLAACKRASSAVIQLCLNSLLATQKGLSVADDYECRTSHLVEAAARACKSWLDIFPQSDELRDEHSERR